MTDADIGYLFDMLEQINTRLTRTESKLTALMHHFNLNAQGVPIDPTNRGYSQNVGARPTRPTKGGHNQR